MIFPKSQKIMNMIVDVWVIYYAEGGWLFNSVYFLIFLTKLLVRAGMFEVGMVKKEILSRLLSRGKHAYPRHLYVQKKPLMGE